MLKPSTSPGRRDSTKSASGKLGAVQAECDQGKRPGPTTDDRDRIKALEREVRELRQANEILRKASAYFAQAELDRPFRK